MRFLMFVFWLILFQTYPNKMPEMCFLTGPVSGQFSSTAKFGLRVTSPPSRGVLQTLKGETWRTLQVSEMDPDTETSQKPSKVGKFQKKYGPEIKKKRGEKPSNPRERSQRWKGTQCAATDLGRDSCQPKWD